MKTSLDHLPEYKRAELERVVSTSPAKSANSASACCKVDDTTPFRVNLPFKQE